MRATSAVVIVGCALLLVSCGTSERQRHARGPAQRVADTITAFQHDLLTRNWVDVCEQVFSSQARAQAGADACPEFVKRGAAGLEAARIRIRAIDVKQDRASASVVTAAAGQAEVPETIEFVYENGSYRIDSLAR
jgi:hypothetical protein